MADVKLPPLPPRVPVDKHLPTGVVIYGYTNDMMCDYARDYARANVAAKDAEIEALRAEVERLQRQLRQTHKDYGCELRDPNGTIWEYAAAQKARVEQLEEALRGLLEKLRGTGMAPLARIRASAALLRKQEEGRD